MGVGRSRRAQVGEYYQDGRCRGHWVCDYMQFIESIYIQVGTGNVDCATCVGRDSDEYMDVPLALLDGQPQLVRNIPGQDGQVNTGPGGQSVKSAL